MKIIKFGAVAIILVLSVLAGAAKLLQVPQEVEFFQSAGLSTTLLMILGGAQIIGAALLIFSKYRALGAIIAGLCFLISAGVIFMTGQIGFAAISLLPVALAGYVFLASRQKP